MNPTLNQLSFSLEMQQFPTIAQKSVQPIDMNSLLLQALISPVLSNGLAPQNPLGVSHTLTYLLSILNGSSIH